VRARISAWGCWVGKPFRRLGPGDAQIGIRIRLHRDMTRTLLSCLVLVAILCSRRYGFTITVSARAPLLAVTALGRSCGHVRGVGGLWTHPSTSGFLQSCGVA